MAQIRYVGGPLNGQVRESTNTWPFYVTVDGHRMAPVAGDRIMRGEALRSNVKVRECYVLCTDTATGVREYVHSPLMLRMKAAGR